MDEAPKRHPKAIRVIIAPWVIVARDYYLYEYNTQIMTTPTVFILA